MEGSSLEEDRSLDYKYFKKIKSKKKSFGIVIGWYNNNKVTNKLTWLKNLDTIEGGWSKYVVACSLKPYEEARDERQQSWKTKGGK